MTASLSLLSVAAAGPRLAVVACAQQAPRLAIAMWQALTVSAVLAVVLAGVTLLISIVTLAAGLGAIVHGLRREHRHGVRLAGLLPRQAARCRSG